MIPFAANAIATLPRRLQQRLPMLLNDADKDNPRKLSFPLGGSAPPSNTWFLRPTGVLFQNGISIGSAVYCTGHRSVSQLYNGPLHYWYCVCVCVCVSVCLSVRISPEPHALSLPIFVHVAYRRGSVLLRRVTQSQRKGAIFGIFFPLTMDCTAEHLGFIQKRLNRSRIKMPFEMMTHVGHRYHVLDGNPIPEGTGQFLGSFNRQ